MTPFEIVRDALAILGAASVIAIALLGVACYGAAATFGHPRDGENESDR